MRFSNLLYSSYWFKQPLILRGWEFYVWLGCFLTITIIGFGVLFYKHYRADTFLKKVLARLSSCFVTLGLVGLLWLWLRQERVLFLSYRFWLLIWLAIGGIWFGKIVRYAVKRVPQIKQEHQIRQMREKYLS